MTGTDETVFGQALLYFGRRVRLRQLAGAAATQPSSPQPGPHRPGRRPGQFDISLPGGLPLPAGHYFLKLPVPDGGGALAGASCHMRDEAGGHKIPVALTPAANGPTQLVWALALGTDAGSLTINLGGAINLGENDAPARERLVQLRKLTRLEFYGRRIRSGLGGHLQRAGGMLPLLAAALRVLRRGGLSGVASVIRGDNFGRAPDSAYQRWIARNERHDDDAMEALGAVVAQATLQPLISVIMPVYNTPATLLRQTIESVLDQVYANWELCVADDCSPDASVRQMLEAYARRDARIRLAFRQSNGHISEASNTALGLASGEWAAMLDHDDILSPDALAEVVLEINRHPHCEIIYSDEDKINLDDVRHDPYFKPDYSRELFRAQNYFNHLTVHRTANIRAVGGWRQGFEGSQDYDLNLRIIERVDAAAIRHIPKVLYHWRAHPGSTALAGSEKNYAFEAGLRALDEHIQRLGLAASVEPMEGVYYRFRHALPAPAPLVSLIIPTRDRVDLLRACIDSILAKTTYANYEIVVVDNGSVEAETHAYFQELGQRANIRVLRYDAPFNFSKINNFAVAHCQGELVGLVNNDIVVISPEWLSEMVSWAAQPDIGCVGAKLYYPNETLQHGGVILGIGGVAGHSHKYCARGQAGYFSRLRLAHNVSAVTAACLLVRRAVYQAVGGLDGENLAVAFNDVDFCLRVRAAGYSNVWTPHAELYHFESVSRGADTDTEKLARFQREVSYMLGRWDLSRDPFYSPNLSLTHEDFSLSGQRDE